MCHGIHIDHKEIIYMPINISKEPYMNLGFSFSFVSDENGTWGLAYAINEVNQLNYTPTLFLPFLLPFLCLLLF